MSRYEAGWFVPRERNDPWPAKRRGIVRNLATAAFDVPKG